MSPAPSWPWRAWSLLTAVPGRPVPSRAMQIRRAAPVLLPALALLALAGWQWGLEAPRARAERVAGRPLLDLEREVAALRLQRPPGGAQAEGRASALRAALPGRQAGLAAFLGPWQAQAAARGWQAAFGPPVVPSAGRGTPVVFISMRASFRPLPGNLHPWSSLLGLLGALSSPETRIDVTRLAIRADEQGRYSVETRLSTPYLADTQDNAK